MRLDEPSDPRAELLAARAEIQRLRETIGGLELWIDQVQEAQAILDRNAQLEQEMAIASRIQTSILPRRLAVAGLEIAARMQPAQLIGGDYYDLIPTDDGCWIGIGDVSGHGVTAGLVMLMTQAVVAAVGRACPHASPAELVPLVNDVLYENVRGRLRIRDFVTFSLLRYRGDGSLTYAGAHEIALIVRASGEPELLPVTGTWLAQRPDVRDVTIDSHAQLGPGDLLVLYTDGITEARDTTGDQLGFDRLVDTIVAARDAPVEDVCAAILATAAAWAPAQEDDRTIIAARQTPYGA
ncbi:MAG TPA: SpoIIE family protein phosphatase [Kofleriaceae bacterium]